MLVYVVGKSGTVGADTPNSSLACGIARLGGWRLLAYVFGKKSGTVGADTPKSSLACGIARLGGWRLLACVVAK